MRNIVRGFRRYPLLGGALAFEMLIMISLMLSLFTVSIQSMEVLPVDFGVEDEKIAFAPDSQDNTIVSRELELMPGAYKVSVYYVSQKDESEKAANVTGRIILDSAGGAAAVKAAAIVLNDGEKCKISNIWIGYGARISDLKIFVKYDGQGTLEIQKLVFEELPLYRVTRVIGFLMLVLLIDGIYIAFFTKIFSISSEKKKRLLFFAGILTVSSIPLFCNDVYYGHDIEFHMNRIVSIAKELSYGHFPARIHSDMLNGYGYATSLFYGDTLLYIPAILYLMKIPLGQCYQLYILINNALTIIFAYICFKAIIKEEKYALVGVFLYTLAPYRLINIYTRAAVGEFTAMTFLPLIVLGFWNIYTKDIAKIRDYLPAIIGLSGVVQSHVISTEMVAIFIGMVCVLHWRKTIEKRRVWCLVKMACLTGALSLWYLVPMMDSMSMDINVTGRSGRIQEQGLYLGQIVSLFFSGVGKSLKNATQGEMGFSLGAALCIGTFLALWVYSEYKRKEMHNALEKSVVTCLGMGIIAVLFTSRFFPWDTLASRSDIVARYLCMIQYPWRYLAIATMLLSIASVGALFLFEKKFGALKTKTVTGGMILLCIISIGYYYYHFTYETGMFHVLSDAECNHFYIGDEEYLLKSTEQDALQVRQIKHTEDVEAVELGRKDGNYTYACRNKSDAEQMVVLPILNYEHYAVRDLEKGIFFEIVNGENNCISVLLPAGYQGNLTVLYQERWLWRVCEIVSLITAAGLAAIGGKKWKAV